MPTYKREVKEETIVAHIKRYLKSLPKCHFEKRWGGGFARSGLPDISGCINGRCFQLEVKRPGGVVSDLQRLELARWNRAGAVTAVVYSSDDVRQVFLDNGLITEEVQPPS
jgi:hypothetical protein